MADFRKSERCLGHFPLLGVPLSGAIFVGLEGLLRDQKIGLGYVLQARIYVLL